ncbi:MAG TPA: hypothetical protein VG815_05455 [Chloroflexota bacterium]|nr:hypothetical protein [Chloroflexota bacterium]
MPRRAGRDSSHTCGCRASPYYTIFSNQCVGVQKGYAVGRRDAAFGVTGLLPDALALDIDPMQRVERFERD